jgi:DNA-binding GntR family transcriptional regulator
VSQAADRAYIELRQLIAAGRFNPGDQLREEHLARLLNLSRTPIREAMRRLEVEGVLERRENRRSYLAALDGRTLDDLFLVRATLESLAAGLAAVRCDSTLVDNLESLAAGMDRALAATPPVYDDLTALNEQFHTAILEASGNQVLASTARGLMRRPLVIRTFQAYSHDELLRSQSHHRELIAALRSHDRSWAESVMRSHILAAASIFRDGAPVSECSRQE